MADNHPIPVTDQRTVNHSVATPQSVRGVTGCAACAPCWRVDVQGCSSVDQLPAPISTAPGQHEPWADPMPHLLNPLADAASSRPVLEAITLTEPGFGESWRVSPFGPHLVFVWPSVQWGPRRQAYRVGKELV